MKIEIKKPGVLYLSAEQLKIRKAVKKCKHTMAAIARRAGISYSAVIYTTRGTHEPSEFVKNAILGAIRQLNKTPEVKVVKISDEPKVKREYRPRILPMKTEYKSTTGTSIYLSPRQHEVRTAVIDSPHSIQSIADAAGVAAPTIGFWIIGLHEPHKYLMATVLETVKHLNEKIKT